MQIPESSPFSPEQKQALSSLLQGMTPVQAAWLGGYLSGIAPQSGAPVVAASAATAPMKVTVLYGTESGNAEGLADEDAKALRKLGFDAKMVNMADVNIGVLNDADNLLVVVSTWGDGDPPDGIGGFFDELMADSAPRLDHIKFSVCALGDTSYEKFCQCGKDIDARLEALGATRLAERVDCDVDYEDPHATWFGGVSALLQEMRGAAIAAMPAPSAAAAAPAVEYGKKNPFPAPVKRKFLLNGEGSQKETWHLELGLEGSGMDYEPGDALGLVPLNAPDVVEDMLAAGGFDANRQVTLRDGSQCALADAFSRQLDITGLTSVVLEKYNTLAQSEKISALLAEGSKQDLAAYLHGRQVIDLLHDFPVPGLDAQDFVSLLRKLPPRLYSIASSLKAHPGEVHLTVAAVRYETHGRTRKGVASTFIADVLGDKLDKCHVYTHTNKNFKLPRSGDTPIIMVGPGTGVAPFRSFVEERAANGDKGRSWLFFGDQRFSFDFMYQLEWQDHLKSGALSRLDVAFSRDQKQKVYVQHRMLDRSRDLWAWLEEGAHFYVCGDASRMAHDVHHALLEIIQREGRLKPDAAEAYVEELKKSKRYQRDVY